MSTMINRVRLLKENQPDRDAQPPNLCSVSLRLNQKRFVCGQGRLTASTQNQVLSGGLTVGVHGG